MTPPLPPCSIRGEAPVANAFSAYSRPQNASRRKNLFHFQSSSAVWTTGSTITLSTSSPTAGNCPHCSPWLRHWTMVCALGASRVQLSVSHNKNKWWQIVLLFQFVLLFVLLLLLFNYFPSSFLVNYRAPSRARTLPRPTITYSLPSLSFIGIR